MEEKEYYKKTKEAVIKELSNIAESLNIKIDYIVDKDKDGYKREYLVCNDTKICTNDTSISGIREEFFGYVFLREWRHRCLGAFETQTKNYIKQYWYDKNMEQPYCKKEFF